MKQSEATEHLRQYMLALQKYRANTFEQFPDFTEEMLGEMWPWVFGDKCPLEALSKLVNSKNLSPMDYYNMMFILDRFTPEIKAGASIMGFDLPAGSPEIIVEWDLDKELNELLLETNNEDINY